MTDSIAAGQRLPSGTFMVLNDQGAPEPLSTDEVFGGRRVVVFALPGAFTRTCSARHLPGYVARAEAFREKGIDEVACLAVNDPFVLAAWGEAHGAGGKVRMLADGTGEYTRALGMEADFAAAGLGRRSRRYAMLVDDGVCKELFLEAPGECRISAADAVLEAL